MFLPLAQATPLRSPVEPADSRTRLPIAARDRLLPQLLTELQALGMRWQMPGGTGLSRLGGAGPSDHKAIQVYDQTLMVPIFTQPSQASPFSVRPGVNDEACLFHDEQMLAPIRFPRQPQFYARSTAEGVPYWKIATLHSTDVLATTVLQTCTRYGNRETSCQFCAIGQSLAARSTIAEKTPAQLAEVARAAVELDGVKHVVMTTGTPATLDRGADVLSRCASAIRTAVDVPVQAQCEPPADFGWFGRMRNAGVDTLGMHLEAVTQSVREHIMPGKAEVPVEVYYEAFAAAVEVFGRAQVSTYILAGLGDTHGAIVHSCRRLIELGVYPFVVPFVPISGTPLQGHPTPSPAFMQTLLDEVAEMLDVAGMKSSDSKAGCGRCGACSSLRSRERKPSPTIKDDADQRILSHA